MSTFQRRHSARAEIWVVDWAVSPGAPRLMPVQTASSPIRPSYMRHTLSCAQMALMFCVAVSLGSYLQSMDDGSFISYSPSIDVSCILSEEVTYLGPSAL